MTRVPTVPGEDGRATDHSLVAAYLDHRDDVAFLALYRRHNPALYAMALRLAGPGSERRRWAEEVVADAWGRALRALGDFEWRAELRTWLTGIVVHCHREAARRRARQPPPAGADPALAPDPTPGPDRGLDLEAALARLPDGYREVVTLYHLYGYKHREIAERLGIAEGTSKSQLARGLARLRTMLD